MLRNPPNESLSRPSKVEEPIRKCVLSGERDERSSLIRLALGPDGQIAPDVHAKAPGRGAWIGVNSDELDKAQQKGKLLAALRRAFKEDKVNLEENLAVRVETALRKALLDRLGLEARAGELICGAERVDTAARSGQVELLLHASDAAEDGAAKRDQSWRVGREAEGSGLKGIRLPVDRDALSAALGRENAVHIAITGRRAAERVKHHLGRWLKFTGCSIDALSVMAVLDDDQIKHHDVN